MSGLAPALAWGRNRQIGAPSVCARNATNRNTIKANARFGRNAGLALTT